MFRAFVKQNTAWSRGFDGLLPAAFRTDGNSFFVKQILPPLVSDDITVIDVGGGKNPFVDAEQKKRKKITAIGIDIDEAELKRAPPGTYDTIYVADICKADLSLAADLVICQSVLEHVRSAPEAFQGLAKLVRPGGKVALFLPSRRAWFARINLLLPEHIKRTMLYSVFPQTERDQGFPAFYDRATIAEYVQLAKAAGFRVISIYPFFSSAYFVFFFPLHFLWRVWMVVAKAVVGPAAAETFSLVLEKL